MQATSSGAWPGGQNYALATHRPTREPDKIGGMQLQKIFIPLGCAALLVVAFDRYGWAGLAVAAGALMMWLLLHFTRLMQILKRAANRPVGYVDSAVMLNVKLRPGVTLMHVIAMTRSLGALQSEKDVQPEVFRWTDGSESHVTCEFWGGKLKKWDLVRPATADELPAESPASAAP